MTEVQKEVVRDCVRDIKEIRAQMLDLQQKEHRSLRDLVNVFEDIAMDGIKESAV